MSENVDQQGYGVYARQRLIRILIDLIETTKGLSWSSLADKITEARGIKFQRQNFYRLRDGMLGDENIEYIVKYLEAHHDPEIRHRLLPEAIFGEVGKSSRDYYFHIPTENYLDEWDEQILSEFSGAYLCAPANDKNSFIPLPVLRRWFADRKTCPELSQGGRSLDIKQYIQERSILILQRTTGSYFHAAEFPMSLLFPPSFSTMDIRMVHEGVGIISSNSIHVQLRECLSRVPKTHSILISSKTANHTGNPFGLSFYLPPGTEGVKEEWAKLSAHDRERLAQEYRLSLEADEYLSGPAQISVSPIPYLSNRVTMNFSRDYVYHRRPEGFLDNNELHFIRSDVENTAEIKKILANPLMIGGLL